MGVNVTVSGGGIEKLLREIADFQRAAKALDGTIATLRFTSDPASVQAAVQQMEWAVDEKVAPFRSNRMVADLVKQLKQRYANHIHKVAESKK